MALAGSAPWPNTQPPANEYCDEDARLRVVASFDLGALEGDDELAEIARFAARQCGAPVGLVSIVESERQLFLARSGLDEPETPRTTSICAHTMQGQEPLIITDASKDPRFSNFALVAGADGVRFYAGVPLISSEGAPLGALCIIDYKPREAGLTDDELQGLRVLADAVKRRLETHRQSSSVAAELAETAAQVRFMLDSVPDIAWSADPGPTFTHFNARWEEITGEPAPTDVDGWRKGIHPEDFEASLAKFETALTTASDFEDEWRLKQADGSYRWVLSRAVPSSDDPATTRWFGTITDINDKHNEAEQRDLLARELSHRIRNIFAVVGGLIAIRARGREEVQGFAEELSETIQALSTAHDYVRPEDAPIADQFHDLVRELLAPYERKTGERITVSGIDLPLRAEATTPLALIIHELATNAAKYGALSSDDGTIDLSIEPVSHDGQKMINLRWRETWPMIDPHADNRDAGFGSTLLKMSVTSQLGGTYTREFVADGLDVNVLVPEERLRPKV